MIPHFEKTQQHQDLSRDEMREAMGFIMDGRANDESLEVFLSALSDKGETPDEITGAAQVLREKVTPATAPANAIDCCGTGGDASGTYNISTTVALVSAACGVPMAKHGNRASSSKSGAADVLEALGVNLDAPVDVLEEALHEIGFAFLMAPNHHSAMRHVAAVRKKMARRTIFNLLGPLANPAGTKRQLLGVFDRQWCKPMAEALCNLGSEAALVVHGAGGLDEISTLGDTHIVELKADQKLLDYDVTPRDFQLTQIETLEPIQGGDAQENARALEAVLRGADNAYADIVVANSAAVLLLAGQFDDYTHAACRAREALDSGAALDILNRYKEAVRS